MDGSAALLASSAALFAAAAMVSLAGLRAWRGWLELRRAQIEASETSGGPISVTALRERVRRLEAIASGLDG